MKMNKLGRQICQVGQPNLKSWFRKKGVSGLLLGGPGKGGERGVMEGRGRARRWKWRRRRWKAGRVLGWRVAWLSSVPFHQNKGRRRAPARTLLGIFGIQPRIRPRGDDWCRLGMGPRYCYGYLGLGSGWNLGQMGLLWGLRLGVRLRLMMGMRFLVFVGAGRRISRPHAWIMKTGKSRRTTREKLHPTGLMG